MKARPLLVLVVASILGASCSTSVEDDALPDCALDNGSAVLLLAQAVPTAELVPCVTDLQPGWRFGGLDAGRGAARLWFDSPSLGSDFLDVRLGDSCRAAADESTVLVPGGSARLSQDVVVTAPPELEIAVVPVASRHIGTANALAAELAGSGLTGFVIPAGASASDRVAAALQAGNFAVVVDDLSVTEAVVHAHVPGIRRSSAVEWDDLVDELLGAQEAWEDQSYRGTWQFRFDGGCATYVVDAAGPGAADLGEHIPAALSFVSRTTLDRFTQVHVGLRLDP